MRHPDPHVHVNHRLTVAGLSDRFDLRLRNGDWEYCIGLDVDAAAILRDQLNAWIDSRTEAYARSAADSPAPPASDSVVRSDPVVYQRDVTWGGGK
jgi:hypothetical protein